MKRYSLLVAATLGIGWFALPSQTQERSSRREPSRVGIVNVGSVFQNYQKAKDFKVQLEKVMAPLKKEAEALKEGILNMQARIADPDVEEGEKDKLNRLILDNRRRLEDLQRDVGPMIEKMQKKQVVELFKDLKWTIRQYAEANGFHAVLAYGDVTEDQDNITNINRIMNGMDVGSLTPLYIQPEYDATNGITELLNEQYTKKPPPKMKLIDLE